MNYSPWLHDIYKSLFSFFFFCSSPLNTALGCSVNHAYALWLHACVCASQLCCWSCSVSVRQLQCFSWLSLLENSESYFPYMQKCDLCTFIIKTWKLWEGVERKVTGFTVEWLFSWRLSSISEPVGRRPHHPFVTTVASEISYRLSILNSILLPQLIGPVCSSGALWQCLPAQPHSVSTDVSYNVCWLAVCFSGVVSYGCRHVFSEIDKVHPANARFHLKPEELFTNLFNQ